MHPSGFILVNTSIVVCGNDLWWRSQRAEVRTPPNQSRGREKSAWSNRDQTQILATTPPGPADEESRPQLPPRWDASKVAHGGTLTLQL
jgi:hypothetical protein